MVTTMWLCGCRSGEAAKAGLLVYALIHIALINRAISGESGPLVRRRSLPPPAPPVPHSATRPQALSEVEEIDTASLQEVG